MERPSCKYCKSRASGLLQAPEGYVCVDCILNKMEKMLKEKEAVVKENDMLRFALMVISNIGNTGDNPVDIACDALLDGQRSHLQKVVDDVGGSLNGGPRADGLPSTLVITYDSDGDENE